MFLVFAYPAYLMIRNPYLSDSLLIYMLLFLKRVWLTALMCLCVSVAFAQATFTTTGDWDNSGNWSGSNIGDDISEDVTINASRVALLQAGFIYTIGNLVMNDFSGLTIDATGSLDVGESGTPRDITAGNNVTITVDGSLIVWGDFNVNGDNLTLNITGTLIVRGDLIMDDAASISVSGDLIVEGNFLADANTNFSISSGGSVSVTGTVTVGTNSNLVGDPGSFFAGGGCFSPPFPDNTFCANGVLPIKLLFFRAALEGNVVSLSWATELEENFDHFEIEKASENLFFSKITEVMALGRNSNGTQHYSYSDRTPYTGPNYYRLKAVDLDGSFEYFNIEFVNYRGERTIDVYPNPVASGVIKFKMHFNPTPYDRISLLDLQGKVMLTESVSSQGIQELNLSSDVKSGLYLLKYSSPAFQRIVKIVVLR
jgi:hypothetical protein